jgi:hypothetical protein
LEDGTDIDGQGTEKYACDGSGGAGARDHFLDIRVCTIMKLIRNPICRTRYKVQTKAKRVVKKQKLLSACFNYIRSKIKRFR